METFDRPEDAGRASGSLPAPAHGAPQLHAVIDQTATVSVGIPPSVDIQFDFK